MDRLLTQFLTVGALGSLSRAARRLNLSQPSLSHNMARLEERIGAKLLARRSRGVELTPEGELLHRRVKAMASVWESALDAVRASKQARRSSLKIGAGHAWWRLGLSDAVREARALRPHAAIHVEFASNYMLLDLLIEGAIDLFLGHETALDPELGVVFEPLVEVEEAYFARPDHPLAGSRRRRRELDAHPRYSIASVIAGGEPRAFSANAPSAVAELAARSDAWFGFPRAAAESLAELGVAPLDVADPALALVGVFHAEESEPAARPETEALIERLRAALERAPGTRPLLQRPCGEA